MEDYQKQMRRNWHATNDILTGLMALHKAVTEAVGRCPLEVQNALMHCNKQVERARGRGFPEPTLAEQLEREALAGCSELPQTGDYV